MWTSSSLYECICFILIKKCRCIINRKTSHCTMEGKGVLDPWNTGGRQGSVCYVCEGETGIVVVLWKWFVALIKLHCRRSSRTFDVVVNSLFLYIFLMYWYGNQSFQLFFSGNSGSIFTKYTLARRGCWKAVAICVIVAHCGHETLSGTYS